MKTQTPPIYSWTYLRKEVTLDDGTRRVILDLGPGHIPAGCMTCILGDSGAGKTTFLSILGLVDTEFEGELTIQLDGESHIIRSTDSPRYRRELAQRLRASVGFVFQEGRLRTGASALRNVVDPMTYVGLGTPDERASSAARALSALGILGEDHDRRVSEFSGGMQQRVAIARAIAAGPNLVCADEPTAHVDSALADQIYGDLKAIAQEQGTTVVVVTHDHERAHRHGDFIARLRRHEEAELEGDSEWPFFLETEDRRPIDKPSEIGEVTSLPTASQGQRVTDMWKEAVIELMPLGQQLFRVLTLSYLRNRKSRQLAPIASHRYMPNLVAIGTFALLSGLAFFLFSVQQSVVGYQQDRLQALELLRRVRAYSPSTAGGQRVPLDIEDVKSFLSSKTDLQQVSANYELLGYALNETDLTNLTPEGYPPAIQHSLKRGSRSLQKRNVKERRLTVSLIGAEKGAPLAIDLGIPVAFHPKGTADQSPQIVINRNQADWYFGGFESTPKVGDKLSIVFAAVPRLVPSSTVAPSVPLAHRPGLCVTFEVSGYFAPREVPEDFFASVRDTNVLNGLLLEDVFQRLLKWKYAPIESDTDIPAAWKCENAPSLPSIRYKDEDESRAPVAASYDFYSGTPRGVEALFDAVQDYGASRSMKYSDLRSEFGYIKGIVQIMDLVLIVGTIMVLLPLFVAAIVLGLVVYNIIQRRRDELLLLRVMGTANSQLQLQSLLITSLLVLPAICGGYFVGVVLPSLIFRSAVWVSLPEQLIHRLIEPVIGLQGLSLVGGASIFIAGVASMMVIRSITTVNPSSAFRGTA